MKQKAKELYDKYFWKFYAHTGKTRIDLTKECVLICVQYLQDNGNLLDIVYKEFEQVKKEINKL